MLSFFVKNEKTAKKLKKGVDKRAEIWYYNQALLKRGAAEKAQRAHKQRRRGRRTPRKRTLKIKQR